MRGARSLHLPPCVLPITKHLGPVELHQPRHQVTCQLCCKWDGTCLRSKCAFKDFVYLFVTKNWGKTMSS
jgi:hypothetical protein